MMKMGAILAFFRVSVSNFLLCCSSEIPIFLMTI